MSTVLITGAGTGIGRYTAEALVDAGHDVWASMRDPDHENADHAQALLDYGRDKPGTMNIVELDVSSQESANVAAKVVTDMAGDIDVVINHGAHLFVGYVEAFSAEQIASLFDANALGPHCVNRAVLPYMRQRGRGTLVYVSSTTTMVAPPFMGPYVASKAAQDMLAVTTSHEVGRLSIETVIVVPGPFVVGTEHLPAAGRVSDPEVTQGYAASEPLVARNETATESPFWTEEHAHHRSVGQEVRRVLTLPYGERAYRTVVDFTHSGMEIVYETIDAARTGFITRMGLDEVLELKLYESLT